MSISRVSFIVTVLSGLSSIMGMLVQMVVAKRYGVGAELDGYLYAISTPVFVSGLLGALLSYTVVPRVAGLCDSAGEKDSFIASLLIMALCVSAGLLMLSPAFNFLQKELLPDHSPLLLEPQIVLLIYVGWAVAAAQIVLATATAVLTGLKKPVVAMILGLGPYLGMLAFMLYGSDNGVEILAYGLLVGNVGALCVALFILHARWFSGAHRANWEEVRALVLSSPYAVLALSCFSSYVVVDNYWAPRAGDGTLATLGYSQRIIIGFGALAVAGPSAIIAPKLSELVALGDEVEFRRLFKKLICYTLAIALLISFGLFIASEWLVKFLFLRGSFRAEDAANVTAVLRLCLPGMVFMLLSVITLRATFCISKTVKQAAIIGVMWPIIYFCLCGLFIDFKASGLAAAYSLTWLICLVFFLSILKISTKNNSFSNRND